MTRREWKKSRKHPLEDFEAEKDVDGASIFWCIVLFILYAIICYHFFGY